MDTQTHDPLHILFFPFLAHGHLLPSADVARLFALRGVRCTILTTPSNESVIRPTVDQTNQTLNQANENLIRENENTDMYHFVPSSIALIPFPSAEVGLPIGLENASDITSNDIRERYIRAIFLLEKPFEQALKDFRPDAVVSDTFFPFSADVAIRFGIPRIVFNGMGLFARCARETVLQSLESFPLDIETVSIPGLPHRLELLRTQIMASFKHKEDIDFHKMNSESDARSYGEIVNSFFELEPDYAVHLREVIGRRAWVIGPVSLKTEDVADKSCRWRGGDKAAIDMEELLSWLDNKPAHSVIYVSFGTLSNFSSEQLREIALALEQGESDFIWVVKDANIEGSDDWMPTEFEESMKREKKGLIIRGWAPQVLILNHQAVGGFVTHCGWNSTVEAISAGLPMVTWPLSSDQIYNEKLIVEILRIGVAIGAKQMGKSFEAKQFVDATTIKDIIGKVMGGGVEEVEAMKQRAKELKEKARKALLKDGSSYVDLENLLEELKAMRNRKGSPT
ncbi:hypothetical protein LUZ60_000676 [Juncus effusus]|nr:hypothetical protein LUZ60_000676 [Juncus effusus]